MLRLHALRLGPERRQVRRIERHGGGQQADEVELGGKIRRDPAGCAVDGSGGVAAGLGTGLDRRQVADPAAEQQQRQDGGAD